MTDTTPTRTIEDYVRALRRSWYVVFASALLFALAGIALAQRSASTAAQSEVTVRIIDESGVAISAGVPPALLDTLSPTQHADALRSQISELLEDKPADVVLTVTADEADRSIVVSAFGPDDGGTGQYAEDLVTAYRGQRATEARERMIQARDIQVAKVGDITEKVAELDDRIASVADTAGVQALGTERIQLVSALIAAQDQALALQGLAGVTTGGVGLPRVVETPAASSSSVAPLAVVGGVVGAMLGTIVVLGLSALDRRLRSRGDVERIVEAPTLGVVPTPSSPQQVESFAAMAGALIHTVGGQAAARVQLVAVSDPRASVAVAEGLSDAMQALGHSVDVVDVTRSAGGSMADALGQVDSSGQASTASTVLVHTTRPLSEGADGAAVSAVVDGTVLVVSAGVTTDRALASAANLVLGSGGRLLGSVLYGVSTRDLEWASAG